MLHLGYFLYGCETWTLTESIEKKITAFEMWIYRRISRTPSTDKVTNQHVLQKINIKSTELVQMIRTRKAKFYAHVRRHDSLQRLILEGKVEGNKRQREKKNEVDGQHQDSSGATNQHLRRVGPRSEEVARHDTQPRKR